MTACRAWHALTNLSCVLAKGHPGDHVTVCTVGRDSARAAFNNGKPIRRIGRVVARAHHCPHGIAKRTKCGDCERPTETRTDEESSDE